MPKLVLAPADHPPQLITPQTARLACPPCVEPTLPSGTAVHSGYACPTAARRSMTLDRRQPSSSQPEPTGPT